MPKDKYFEDNTFNTNLVRYRKLKGLSQKELAEKTGISQRMINYYEKTANCPPIDKIKIIAKALKVKVSELIEDEKDNYNELADIDPRTLKKILQIKKLPPKDRNTIYRMIDSMVREVEAQS